ncbi:MAG: DNA mismatch repair endonuclease MutL [Schleiferiaceae bacterium]
MSRAPIRALPESVANLVAAGEVVQRPSSVVKELVENALDAGATEVDVVLLQAGRTRIQVRDNGHGIDPEDLPLALVRHATSKLREPDDLFALTTMGFRGEALASMAAVGQVSLRSRTADHEVGLELRCFGGEHEGSNPSPGPVGTTVTVDNLFFNVPARRQFLKSDPVEFKHVLETFDALALAHPEVRLILRHNGTDERVFEAGNLRQRVAAVLGRRSNEKLVPLEEGTDLVRVHGFVLRPEVARKTRGDQYLFVNRRTVRSPYIHRAVLEAFEGLIPGDLHPGYVLFLDLDPERIDVNVHPAKTEIKFDDERGVYAVVRSTVRRALGIHQIAPTLDFEVPVGEHIDWSAREKPDAPGIYVNPNYNPFAAESAPPRPSAAAVQAAREFFAPPSPETWGVQHELELPSAGWNDSADSAADRPVPPSARALSVAGMYALVPLPDTLVVVQLDRALRRIELERWMDGSLQAGQHWLFPQEWTPQPGYMDQWAPRLHAWGFSWELDGPTCRWTSGPAFCSPESALDWLEGLHHVEADDDLALRTWISQWLNAQTRRGHDPQDVVDRLFACREPWTDDLGRPTARLLNADELARFF